MIIVARAMIRWYYVLLVVIKIVKEFIILLCLFNDSINLIKWILLLTLSSRLRLTYRLLNYT